MKKLKSNLGFIAFVLLAVVATSSLFVLNASSQASRKGDNDVSISWTPKKQQIKSTESKFALNLPDSVSSQNWVVGVMPVGKDENETIVTGLVSWKDSKMGARTFIDNVIDLSGESITLADGRADFSKSTEFSSDNGKSLLILLKVKPDTEINILQSGKTVLTKTFTGDGEIVAQPEQVGMATMGLKRVTGPSSLLGELQTRRLSQLFGKSIQMGGKNQ